MQTLLRVRADDVVTLLLLATLCIANAGRTSHNMQRAWMSIDLEIVRGGKEAFTGQGPVCVRLALLLQTSTYRDFTP